ncbi:MAG: hypothetical protein ACI9EF_002776 [Pseudohongiellaceae bacterium]|jgi:hypothetical protein
MKRVRDAGGSGGSEASKGGRGVVGFAAGLLCALGLQFILDLGESPTAASADAGDAGSAVASRALVEELRGIREVLETGGALALQRGSLAKTSAKTAAPQPAATRERLSPWFEQLDQRLAELVDLIVPMMTHAQASGFAQGAETLPVVEAFLDVELNRHSFMAEAFPPVDDEVATAIYSRHHVLWREQQVLDAYGPPEAIEVSVSGEHYWAYGEGDDQLDFVIFHGRVIRVEW